MKTKKQSLIVTIILLLLGGCAQPRQSDPNPSLVFHVGGTLYNPKITPEFSRNDKYLGIRTDSQRERYMRHLSLTIKSIDRQTTINGRVSDRHITETRTESK